MTPEMIAALVDWVFGFAGGMALGFVLGHRLASRDGEAMRRMGHAEAILGLQVLDEKEAARRLAEAIRDRRGAG